MQELLSFPVAAVAGFYWMIWHDLGDLCLFGCLVLGMPYWVVFHSTGLSVAQSFLWEIQEVCGLADPSYMIINYSALQLHQTIALAHLPQATRGAYIFFLFRLLAREMSVGYLTSVSLTDKLASPSQVLPIRFKALIERLHCMNTPKRDTSGALEPNRIIP